MQQLEAAFGRSFAEDQSNLLADALPRDAVDLGRCPPDDAPRAGVDREVEARGDADRAQHAELVFLEAGRGVSDRAYDAARQVVAAADVVDDPIFDGIEEHTVDREIAPGRVLARVAEGHRDRMARIEVDAVAAKRRDLDAVLPRRNQDDAELRADR